MRGGPPRRPAGRPGWGEAVSISIAEAATGVRVVGVLAAASCDRVVGGGPTGLWVCTALVIADQESTSCSRDAWGRRCRHRRRGRVAAVRVLAAVTEAVAQGI